MAALPKARASANAWGRRNKCIRETAAIHGAPSGKWRRPERLQTKAGSQDFRLRAMGNQGRI